MQKMLPALTERQRYWLEHVQACEASGKSIAKYAAAQGIAAHAMYGGKKILLDSTASATRLKSCTGNAMVFACGKSVWSGTGLNSPATH